MKYNDLIINGEPPKPKNISKMIRSFSNLDILNSYGGYIFTFRRDNNITYLGIKPAILDGQRSNHFELNAGPETKIFLTGGINANTEISLLFKIQKTELTEKVKSELRELYINLASLFIINGYNGTGTLDWITRNIIEKSELFSPIPTTIFDL